MKARAAIFLIFCLCPVAVGLNAARAAANGFRFVSWGDTQKGLKVLAGQSNQAKAMNPALTIYCGDLVSKFNLSNLDIWKRALNGNQDNGIFNKTFAVRGNHDKGNQAEWQGYFSFSSTASAVGAANYRFMTDDLTYSFDYGNAHFIGADVLGDVTLLSIKQLDWMDRDLAAAERRGLIHAFLFWHGPLYPVGGHCCSASRPDLVAMANRHPIVSATFHGHEHQLAWVHIDKKRYSNATHEFEEFVTGSSGADTKGCKTGRSDYCRPATGFAVVDVSGRSFTVMFYLRGSATPDRSFTFVKSEAGGDTKPSRR